MLEGVESLAELREFAAGAAERLQERQVVVGTMGAEGESESHVGHRQVARSQPLVRRTGPRAAVERQGPPTCAKQVAAARQTSPRLALNAALVVCLLATAGLHCQTTGPTTTSAAPKAVLTASSEQTTTAAVATTTTTTESTSTTTTMSSEIEPTNSPTAQNATANKLRPVNFTLVDEVFESVLADDEVVRRWRHMDAQFQDGIRSILKLVFPQIVAISQDAKVSGDCSGGILKWILSLRNLRSWAIKSE